MKAEDLKTKHIYYDTITEKEVEFRHMSQEGYAIVREYGDNGGIYEMKSNWGVLPEKLKVINEQKCPDCNTYHNEIKLHLCKICNKKICINCRPNHYGHGY